MLIQSLVLFTKHSLALLYEEIMSLNRSFFVYFFDIYTFLEIVLLLFSKCFEFSNLFNSVSFENLLEVIMSYYYVVFVDKVFIRFVFVFTVMMLVHDIFIFILHLFVVFVVGIIFVLHRFFRLFLNFLLVFLTPILQAISICPYFLFFFCISIPNIFDRCQVSLEILYF